MSLMPTKQVEAIEFGLLSPDTIRKMSVARIITADTYDEDGLPITGGLMDGRLGTIEPGQRCKTCGNRVGECPGHFGHIELARPVIHVGYAKLIYKILRATCRQCGRLKLSEKEREEFRERLHKTMKFFGQTETSVVEEGLKKARTETCPHCESNQNKIKLEKPTTFYEETEEGPKKLSSLEIREWLEKIPNEDCDLIGIDSEKARPEWIIWTVLPVPPVVIRPSITLESGVRSEDDLTHKLVDIIRINQKLRENIEAGAPSLIVEDLWELLQYHATTLLDNEVSGIPPARHRSGRALRTISQRLKGKEGRFRSNLSGKRVDFSARTVISPDPNLSINEVGIPEEVAKILTVPEKVTDWNIEALKRLVLAGPTEVEGANYVVRPDGRRIDLRFVRDKQTIADSLEPKYIIERHIRDGDLVLFNRQPSLHRMSIMAHMAKIMPHRTFRLNLCVCVAPDTKVLLQGTQRKIEQLKNCWKESQVLTVDLEKNNILTTELKAFWALKPEQYGQECYRIITEMGRKIEVTGDHPLYTKDGIKAARKLKVFDKIIVYPTDFPEYEEVDKIILDEKDIIKSAPQETYINHCLKELKNRGLLVLNLLNNPKSIILAKLLGHLFGDGTFIMKKDSSRIIFRGHKEDLECIQQDIRLLGFEPEKIVTRKSNGEIKTANGKILKVQGKGSSFEIRNKPLGILLNALGAPNGDKTISSYSVPRWIMEAPKYIKKEFLSTYFGCELTKPKVRKTCKKLFKELTFKVCKSENKLSVGIKFVEDIKSLLKEFNIGVSISKEKGNIRKDGTKTVVIKVPLNSDIDTMINFFGKIGYGYNKSSDTLARLIYQYLRIKKKETEKRNEILKKVLVAKRGELKKISRENKIPIQTIYQWRYKKSFYTVTSPHFIDFDAWVQRISIGHGLVLETVRKIENIEIPYVYDITTSSETHNFIANGFLTGNCPPYNADFDGDEMNAHIPQGGEAKAEALELMLVQVQILSPRYGGPIIGAIQDYITSAFLLTKKDTFLNKKETCQLLLAAGYSGPLPPPEVTEPEPMWSGKQIISLIIPKGLNMTLKSNNCRHCETCKEENCPYDAYVKIRDGRLICGVLDRKTLGAQQPKNMTHRIVKEFGSDEARRFLDSLGKLLIAFISRHGFSMGLKDVSVLKEAQERIHAIIEEKEKKVLALIESFKKRELERLPGRTEEETLEMQIRQELSDARDTAGEVITSEYLNPKNPIAIMAKSGARGSALNLAQMIACVGQQSVRGERISRGYKNRTLPHFKPGDMGAKAKGFVESSFRKGLEPIEFFFHASGGREGLVDTAVRTSTSGYMQRRLINALQDLKAEYDGTIRNAIGDIIQFKFGEDGIDPSKSDYGKAVDVDVIIENFVLNKRREEV